MPLPSWALKVAFNSHPLFSAFIYRPSEMVLVEFLIEGWIFSVYQYLR